MFFDFITKYTDIFVEKMRETFALQKLLTYWHILDINVWKFNETLTNDVVSVEQLGPALQQYTPLSTDLELQFDQFNLTRVVISYDMYETSLRRV